jgi:hypothetical protein
MIAKIELDNLMPNFAEAGMKILRAHNPFNKTEPKFAVEFYTSIRTFYNMPGHFHFKFGYWWFLWLVRASLAHNFAISLQNNRSARVPSPPLFR